MTDNKHSTGTLKTLPPAPRELNEEAEIYYNRLGKILIENNLFFEGDMKAFCRLCHLYTMADALEKEMNEAWGASLFKSSFTIYDKLLKNILSLETAFQLNPSSRSRSKIQIDKPKKRGFDLSSNGHEKATI